MILIHYTSIRFNSVDDIRKGCWECLGGRVGEGKAAVCCWAGCVRLRSDRYQHAIGNSVEMWGYVVPSH